jgi:hypothetical protein
MLQKADIVDSHYQRNFRSKRGCVLDVEEIGAIFADSACKIPTQPNPGIAGDFVYTDPPGQPGFGFFFANIGQKLGIAVEGSERP